MTGIIAGQSNVFDYFREAVDQARADSASRVSEDTGLYLAHMLTDRVRADRAAPAETTLAELHARASSAPPAEQARAYRELGDRTLMCLGLFRESLARKTVGPAYYADMGSAAYARADLVFKRWFSDAFGPVFGELAAQFRACVGVLAQIRQEHERREVERLALTGRLNEGVVAPDARLAAFISSKPGIA